MGRRVSARRRYRVAGVVQGVGYRPFVYGLAARYGLGGFVLNDGDGVLIEAEGDPSALELFAQALEAEAPWLARVEGVSAEPLPPLGERRFEIAASRPGAAPGALIPPDLATCEACLRELRDPADRRYRYPFLNCTSCGPRFTIARAAPFDRSRTAMAAFPPCGECRREYLDPGDRRFHAQAICCPACGPRLSLPLEQAVELLRGGAVVAVKGIGGWHLACSALDEGAVARLRARKHREEKPFALMTSAPESLGACSPAELELLGSPERPIVLVRRRAEAEIAPSAAPGTERLGLMLPYSGLHHLLCDDFGGPLVLTSGNRSDEPIACDDSEARSRLAPIADAFLGHDRVIHRRCEDSVANASFPVRRSRGYVPARLPLPVAAARPIVAAGAELKATFCVARGRDAYLSPHLGDLDSEPAHRAFRSDLELYLAMLATGMEVVAHDLHPEYLSTKWALEQDAELVGVQHHHAHAAACLAEHGEEGPALALVFDGSGYGSDGTLWGSELAALRPRHIRAARPPRADPAPGRRGGDQEPWRVAAVQLERAGLPVPFARWPLVRESLKLDPPLACGDGPPIRRGRGPARSAPAGELRGAGGGRARAARRGRWKPTRTRGASARAARSSALSLADLAGGRPHPEIAAAFHESVAAAAAEACAEAGGPRTVVLSGGTFQNLRLLGSTRQRLERLGFRVLTHRLVPPNDGGISYGQAAVAARRTAPCA